MRKRKKSNNWIIVLILICLFGISIGYSELSSNLSVTGQVTINVATTPDPATNPIPTPLEIGDTVNYSTSLNTVTLNDDIVSVSDEFAFNFENAGFMREGIVSTVKVEEKVEETKEETKEEVKEEPKTEEAPVKKSSKKKTTKKPKSKENEGTTEEKNG